MSVKRKEITIIGNAIVDVLVGPVNAQVFQTGSQPVDRIKLSFGGDALNQAVLLSRFGKKVELLSKVGEDEAGRRVRSYLEENGVFVSKFIVEPELDTSINIVLIDERGERFFLTDPQSSQRKLREEDVLPFLDSAADIVSFASMFISASLDIPAMLHVFQRIKSRPERILAVDLTKAKHGERLEDLKGLLPYVDFIFPNEEEAALLTGEKDPLKNAALFVEAGVKCAVIKCGSRGCVICTQKETLRIPAFPGVSCADTTGAGDSFAAGFLWAFSERYSLEDCGRFACAAASCAVEQVGATEGIASLDRPLERFRKYPFR